jgi:2-polyprenyl-3-methyl-5-hydroxy-6-metoxy-1,4-benzoquinol methylase
MENKVLNDELAQWNDRMYRAHPTPYAKGVAGIIQKARVKTVLHYAHIRPADAVLELGCESGHLLVESPSARRLVGADISAQALADAQSLFKMRGRTGDFFQVDALQPLPFQRGEFDVIICSEMLEHVSDPRQAMENIRAICSPKTRVVLTVPIEAPKIKIKKFLHRLGLLRIFFPGIEVEQSEWHLQAFSRRMLLEMAKEFFTFQAGRLIWGAHYAAVFRIK